ncbi:hypothetical protein [Ensifer adhaerens]|uniref:hypothetical protein n=1 Tax=Ensifer adhaerens TaxID=106592 RepID=UPI001319F702|nr:hypothetical protein [Ensifer adhaerens]
MLTTEQAINRQADQSNLLHEALRLLKIVRNDYNSAYPFGVDWAQQVDKLLDQHRAQQ